ncbi:sigma-70 family RNA polymerase sigma factor [Planctomicrobium sp. SH661]|uniref:sigma-70 family RNA polymerase sigma factor n=1 Tax=Planctomicrobium sp. SH661 TaxID=3448124 RepID=UPI003F5C1034
MSEIDRHQELARLWTRHLPVVETFVASLCLRPGEVEELLQETVTQLFQQIDRFDFSRPFLPWAMGVARYVVLQYKRDCARDRHLFSQEAVENLSRAFEAATGPQDALRQHLTDCFQKLSRQSQRLCQLRYEQNLGRAEIAKTQGASLAAVKMGLHRLRQQLRTCVERRLQAEGRS